MTGWIRTLAAALLVLSVQCAASGAFAKEWRVGKSSGEVWVTPAGGQQTPLTEATIVRAGDSVRTGQTGRVLLKRGEETLLVSPNSVVSIGPEKEGGLTTTLVQQAGTILLEVEKRNVKHFAVETPYLAAVVKGTQFRVSVNQGDSRVDVLRGQVEVQDFKSGQYTTVMPSQTATVSLASVGLLLSGSGALNPIRQGTPRSAPASYEQPRNVPAPAAPAASTKSAAVMSSPPPAPVRNWAPTASSNSDWSSWFGSFGKSIFGSGGRHNQTDDIVLAVGVAGFIGCGVSLGVALQRRRKSRKVEEN